MGEGERQESSLRAGPSTCAFCDKEAIVKIRHPQRKVALLRCKDHWQQAENQYSAEIGVEPRDVNHIFREMILRQVGRGKGLSPNRVSLVPNGVSVVALPPKLFLSET